LTNSLTNAGHPLRPALGFAQSAVSIVASLGLLVLGVSLLRGVPVARGQEFVWPERAVALTGIGYLVAACLIHSRWGSQLRRGHSVGQEVAAAVCLGHLIVALAVIFSLARGIESRLLIAQLQSPGSAWLTVACIGCLVSGASCWLASWESHAANTTLHPTLAGWQHALPPFVLAVVFAGFIIWLESVPLPLAELFSG